MNTHAILRMITVFLLGFTWVNYSHGQEPAKEKNGKTTSQEVRKEVADAAEAIKNYSADKRDEAAQKSKEALDALDARINELQQQIDKDWDKMDKAAREQARNTMVALHKQRVKAAEWYGGLKNSTSAAWEDMKKGFSDAYKSLQHAWEKAEQRYREDEKENQK